MSTAKPFQVSATPIVLVRDSLEFIGCAIIE